MTRTVDSLSQETRGTSWLAAPNALAFDSDGWLFVDPHASVSRTHSRKPKKGKLLLQITDLGDFCIYMADRRGLDPSNQVQPDYLPAVSVYCQAQEVTYTRILPGVCYTTLNRLTADSKEDWWLSADALKLESGRGYVRIDQSYDCVEAQTKLAKNFVPVRWAGMDEAAMAADTAHMPYQLVSRDGCYLQVAVNGQWLLLNYPS